MAMGTRARAWARGKTKMRARMRMRMGGFDSVANPMHPVTHSAIWLRYPKPPAIRAQSSLRTSKSFSLGFSGGNTKCFSERVFLVEKLNVFLMGFSLR